MFFFFYGYGDHRDLHVLTPSFPTRRSSDLLPELVDDVQIVHGVSAFVRFEICRGALAAVGGAGPIGLRDEETPAGEQEPAPPQLISACRLALCRGTFWSRSAPLVRLGRDARLRWHRHGIARPSESGFGTAAWR